MRRNRRQFGSRNENRNNPESNMNSQRGEVQINRSGNNRHQRRETNIQGSDDRYDPQRGIQRNRFGEGSFDNSDRRGNNSQRNNFRDERYYKNENNTSRNYNRTRLNDNSDDAVNQNERPRNQYNKSRMGYKFAEKIIAESDIAEDIVQGLLNDRNGFKELLKDNDLSGDWLVLIIQMLTKVCDTSFTDSKIQIFHMVFVHSSYTKQLISFISNFPNHNGRDQKMNSRFWNDTDTFWNNLLVIFEDIAKLPSFASQSLPILLKAIKRTLPAIEEEHGLHISDTIKEHFDVLLTKIQSMKSDYAQKPQEGRGQDERNEDDEDDIDPPNDFREINVYPNVIEVTSNNKPFLRKNKIIGPYRGINHYLDVQFRLLREDFVSPMRRGICQYLENPKERKYDDVRIYQKIHFLANENVNDLNCVRLKYDFRNTKKSFKYENSKLFMYGSLVCFTRDRFRSLIFGKIVNRESELLKKGELVVGFHNVEDISFNTDYIMVESSVYFEPYYHVLTALQRMSSDQFPMERYLIYAEKEVDPPRYLDPTTSYIIENKRLIPLLWGNTCFSLNESQNIAFRAALTQEIAVIQGPPGTGKTFLGLKITRTLLQNKEVWYRHSPILVICYTNHALDQFLEGILPHTKLLLRIGGQSKNENLNKYNLRNVKHTKKSAVFYQSQRELKICVSDLKACDNAIDEILQYNSVIDFSLFNNVVPNFSKTWFCSATREDILNWLLGEMKDDLDNLNRSAPPSAVNNEVTPSVLNSDSDSDGDESECNDRLEEFDEIYYNNEPNMTNLRPLISLHSINAEIESLQLRFAQVFQSDYGFVTDHEQIEDEIKMDILNLRKKFKYLQLKLDKVKIPTEILAPYELPHLMSPKQRWALYANWLHQYCQFLRNKREKINEEYREKHKIYSDQKNMEDVRLMKEKLVVGMTTTGAARLRTSLEALRSPIVIVEEAAEVLEAHLVSALTVRCQHLILIGDHKQLKPSTADYKIETEYLLGVSLFERMVNNNLQCYRLNVQHRMKPQICDLIRPTIYPDLMDHDSVLDRPAIKGIENDLFFIDHEHLENACDNSSKKNAHEAKFLINLAKYLILNGYKAENITILAAYLGQMFEMQREKKQHNLLLRDVRIAVLDNYQGEESDIILLSLVRNNKEGKIGFLKIENRVCVALSRARNGLYIMGNMRLLSSNSPLWHGINDKLVKRNAIGKSLMLRCTIHGTFTKVETGEDFVKVPEGGCSLNCEAELICGHLCKSICHLTDRNHDNYKCLEPCTRLLCDEDITHICKRRCFKTCGPCSYLVTRQLPCHHIRSIQCYIDPQEYKCDELVLTELDCGHIEYKPCHIKTEDFECPRPCDSRVEQCGHACTLLCHVRKDPDHLLYKCTKPCARPRAGCTSQDGPHLCKNLCCEECEPCELKVKKKRTVCSHVYNVPCNSNVDEIKCEKPCTRNLFCGHKCLRKCFENCEPCEVKMEKIIPECGHKIIMKCCETPDRKYCRGKCNRVLPCGHVCSKKYNEICTTACKEKKTCNLMSPCGHIVKEIKCYKRVFHNDPYLLKCCKEPCNVKLKCNHICKGTCGACSQGRIHERCGEKCGVFLICNHECPIPCRDACKPCEKNCSYRCNHSSCKKKCGDICTKCTETCERDCMHQKCKNVCGDICSVGPCKQPCPKLLNCGHTCIGFCNDPCPNKCRICDKDEITEVFFGTEDEVDARFVTLQDCKHILESTGIEAWLGQEGGEIQSKVCPKCKTPIINTQRYSDYVKIANADIDQTKKKILGSPAQNDQRRSELLARITVIQQKSLLLPGVTTLIQAIKLLEERLQKSRPMQHKRALSAIYRQPINGLVLDSITSKIQILEYIIKICCTPTGTFTSLEIETQVNFILKCLVRDEDQITIQEIEDIELEINRLKRIVEIFQIKTAPKSKGLFSSLGFSTNTADEKMKMEIEELVFSAAKYTKATDDEVQRRLKKLNTRVPISDAERRDIVKALGLSKGHWFKCPNGHPYLITECGGAMQESNCPECGARIGGSSHRLLSSNRLAPEMDGAQFPAWGDVANNMQNYDL